MPLGCEVRVSTSPDDMLAQLEQWKPTHIALDLIMPAKDGVEILHELALRECKAQILLMSGVGVKVLETTKQAALYRGLNVVGVLPKPFAIEKLRALLSTSSDNKDAKVTGDESGPVLIYSLGDILHALHDSQFVLYYQPKIRLSDLSIVGYEALLRWEHPRHGLLLPERFMPQVEGTMVMHPLTFELFNMGLQWLGTLGPQTTVTLSINFSASTLEVNEFVERLYQSCLTHDILPSRVILEITESSTINQSAVALDALSRLRIKGFSLSIDDYGTGYSTMKQLSRLPFSELKLDRSFVASMQKSLESHVIVESTISLGHKLAMVTCAEGVEDKETLAALRALGCDLAQGFYFARPMPGPEALRLHRDWKPKSHR